MANFINITTEFNYPLNNKINIFTIKSNGLDVWHIGDTYKSVSSLWDTLNHNRYNFSLNDVKTIFRTIKQ